MTATLTKAQSEILEDVRKNGPQRYNGLMEKAIRSLEAAGLVTVEFDLLLGVRGSRRRFTVTAKAQ